MYNIIVKYNWFSYCIDFFSWYNKRIFDLKIFFCLGSVSTQKNYWTLPFISLVLMTQERWFFLFLQVFRDICQKYTIPSPLSPFGGSFGAMFIVRHYIKRSGKWQFTYHYTTGCIRDKNTMLVLIWTYPMFGISIWLTYVPDLDSWPWKSRSNILSNDLH